MIEKTYVKQCLRDRLKLWVNQCAKFDDLNRYVWMFSEFADGCILTAREYDCEVDFLNFTDIYFIFRSLVEYRKGVQ